MTNRHLSIAAPNPSTPDRQPSFRHVAQVNPNGSLSISRICEDLQPSDDDEPLLACTPKKLPQCDLSKLQSTRSADLKLIDFVQAHARGLVHYSAGVDRVKLVAQIVRAFPGIKLAVAVLRDRETKTVAAKLADFGIDASWVTNKSCPEQVKPVVVSTYYGLAHDEIEAEQLDLVIAWDAVESLGSRPELALAAIENVRLLGFVPHGKSLAPYDEQRLDRWYGKSRLEIPKHGYSNRKVLVGRLAIKQGPDLAGAGNVFEAKQQGIWNNKSRNAIIARLARSLEQEGLKALGFSERVRRAPGRSNGARTGILVENVEHALKIARKLPGWGIISGDQLDLTAFTAADRELLVRPRWPRSTRKIIVTLAGLKSADLSSIDVLIRADGGVGIPADLPSKLITGNSTSRPLTLVDCADKTHPLLRKNSRSRLKAYEAQNWPCCLLNLNQLAGAAA